MSVVAEALETVAEVRRLGGEFVSTGGHVHIVGEYDGYAVGDRLDRAWPVILTLIEAGYLRVPEEGATSG